MHNPKFFTCDQGRVLIEEMRGEKDGFACDGVELRELVPNTTEGAHEKHLPVVELEGDRITIKVGSVFHPMTEEHSIEWVYLKTQKGSQRVDLTPNGKPEAEFRLAKGDKPVAAYAYCNQHGFWKTEI